MTRDKSSSNVLLRHSSTNVQRCGGDVAHDGKARVGSAAGTPENRPDTVCRTLCCSSLGA
jgi:hypothetical protein